MGIEVVKVTERRCEDDYPEASGIYYDVEVLADGVRGTVSIERNGDPIEGSNSVSDWATASLVDADVNLDEVRAVAAKAVRP